MSTEKRKYLRIEPSGYMELRDLDPDRDILDVIHDIFGMTEEDCVELYRKLHGMIIMAEFQSFCDFIERRTTA